MTEYCLDTVSIFLYISSAVISYNWYLKENFLRAENSVRDVTSFQMNFDFEILRAGPEVIKLFPCSTQLSMKFFLLINVEMPTIVGILTFISGLQLLAF